MYFGTLNSIPKKKKKINSFGNFFGKKLIFGLYGILKKLQKKKFSNQFFLTNSNKRITKIKFKNKFYVNLRSGKNQIFQFF